MTALKTAQNVFSKLTLALAGAALAHNAMAITEQDVAHHYTKVAHAVFEDALITAQDLDKTIDALVENPSEATLAAAKTAWKAARKPYLQSEVFRFGNAVVDDWEGQLNAWPLDEGLIDYVAKDYEHEMGNSGATANLVASTSIQVGAKKLDVSTITPELLADLNELGGSEANVASGYHAIEFLLWGQDLNVTPTSPGQRPHTDYATGDACTGGSCERRAQYLQAASELLIQDLQYMTSQWTPGQADNYANTFSNLPNQEALTRILYGMGSLSLGELAGERMKVALDANSMEDEQDCFSDNTHNSHYYNAKGIDNVYFGRYTRASGEELTGPSIAQLIESKDADLAKTMANALSTTETKLSTMVDAAEAQNPMKFDQMIAPGNEKGAAIVQNAIAALATQTGSIDAVAKKLGIENLNPDTADHTF